MHSFVPVSIQNSIRLSGYGVSLSSERSRFESCAVSALHSSDCLFVTDCVRKICITNRQQVPFSLSFVIMTMFRKNETNPLPNDKSLEVTKLKALADKKFSVAKMMNTSISQCFLKPSSIRSEDRNHHFYHNLIWRCKSFQFGAVQKILLGKGLNKRIV